MSKFVHLHVHSPYSLAEGACRIEEAIAIARDEGMPAIGLADTNTLAGAFSFSSALSGAGLQPILGCQVTLRYLEDAFGDLTLLAQNETGWINLMNLVSRARITTESNRIHTTLKHIHSNSDGVICLSGGWIGPLDKLVTEGKLDKARALARYMKDIFGDRFYLELQRYGRSHEASVIDSLLAFGEDMNIPAVASVDVYYSKPEMHEAHDVLRCIARGQYFADIQRERLPEGHHFKTNEEMANLFADLPEALEASLDIAQRCAFHVRKAKPSLPRYPDVAENETEEDTLARLAKEGLEARLLVSQHGDRQEYDDRLAVEIDVINRMGFAGYFLIVSDFINWAKSNGIAVGPGRGSGAGSLVAYSLGITDLDPLRFGLLFERFLNPDRVSMPDFDVDFCQERRGEVIEYVKTRYGTGRVAQIGTLGKLAARGVLRDVGRVLGLPYPVVDRWVRMIPNNPAHPVSLPEAMQMEDLANQLDRADANVRRMFQLAVKLENLYRNASTHAAGVVIADRNLKDVVPLMRDEHGHIVTQFDMKAVESIGLVKFDFLGLKTLDVIDQTSSMICSDETDFDISKIDDRDPKTYEMLTEGDSYGVFQLESPGMRQAMVQIAPTRIEDLIALVSLYRPGPMENIPTYAAVKAGYQPVEYPHPTLQPILEETHGVIIYQEQVMQVARDMAGYTLAQADLLRRAMGKKIASEMAQQKQVFVEGALSRGHADEDAKRVFDLVARFAEYGFNKSHAAAYALIAFQTAYLKRHYPTEFLVANLNIETGNADKVASFIQEGLRQRLIIMPPDVNASIERFSIERKNNTKIIRYGLGAIRNCGKAVESVVVERQKTGPYASLADLVRRTQGNANKRMLESLIQAGACDTLHPNRAAMLQALPALMKDAQNEMVKRKQPTLFADTLAPSEELPAAPEPSALQKLVWEVNSLGLGLTQGIREGWAKLARKHGAIAISHVRNGGGRKSAKIGGIVTDVTAKTTKDRKPFTVINLCDPSGSLELAMFNETNTQYRSLIKKHEGFFFDVDIADRSGRLSFFVKHVEPIEEID